MNKSLKKKWTKALRSDEYVQGTNQLVAPCGDYDEFCCLGVLCDVMGVEFEYGFSCLVIAGTLHSSTLPDSLLKEAGLNFGEQKELMDLNDNEYWDFNNIANWIDENL